jgi:hypothetical protein
MSGSPRGSRRLEEALRRGRKAHQKAYSKHTERGIGGRFGDAVMRSTRVAAGEMDGERVRIREER